MILTQYDRAKPGTARSHLLLIASIIQAIALSQTIIDTEFATILK